MPMDKYLKALEGKVFKCIPIFETDRDTLNNYIQSLLIEMEGAVNRFPPLGLIDGYVDIQNTLSFFYGSNQYSHSVLRKEILKCMSILNKINQKNGGVNTD